MLRRLAVMVGCGAVLCGLCVVAVMGLRRRAQTRPPLDSDGGPSRPFHVRDVDPEQPGVAECGPLTSICERKPDLCQQTWRDVSSGGRWCTGAHSERWITYVERGDACGELSFLRVSGVDGWTIYYFDRSGALVGLAARGGMGHRSCAGRVPSPETACRGRQVLCTPAAD